MEVVTDANILRAIEEEDLMWALNKYSRYCSRHKRVLTNLRSRVKFSLNECCGGDINCKFGAHYDNENVCIDDLINGDCKCSNKNIKIEIENINRKINECKKDDPKKFDFIKKLKELEEINLNTKIHLTTWGLKPFSIQIDEFNKNKNEEELSDPTSIKNLMKDLKVDDSEVKVINKIKKIKRKKKK